MDDFQVMPPRSRYPRPAQPDTPSKTIPCTNRFSPLADIPAVNDNATRSTNEPPPARMSPSKGVTLLDGTSTGDVDAEGSTDDDCCPPSANNSVPTSSSTARRHKKSSGRRSSVTPEGVEVTTVGQLTQRVRGARIKRGIDGLTIPLGFQPNMDQVSLRSTWTKNRPKVTEVLTAAVPLYQSMYRVDAARIITVQVCQADPEVIPGYAWSEMDAFTSDKTLLPHPIRYYYEALVVVSYQLQPYRYILTHCLSGFRTTCLESQGIPSKGPLPLLALLPLPVLHVLIPAIQERPAAPLPPAPLAVQAPSWICCGVRSVCPSANRLSMHTGKSIQTRCVSCTMTTGARSAMHGILHIPTPR